MLNNERKGYTAWSEGVGNRVATARKTAQIAQNSCTPHSAGAIAKSSIFQRLGLGTGSAGEARYQAFLVSGRGTGKWWKILTFAALAPDQIFGAIVLDKGLEFLGSCEF